LFAGKWMELENFMLGSMSLAHMCSLMCGSWTYKLNTNMDTCWNCSKKGGGHKRENDGGCKYDKHICKHICKYNNVSPFTTTIY
jgi:hypothetical protein